MDTKANRRDCKPVPPIPDESYWTALLSEGEHAQPSLLDDTIRPLPHNNVELHTQNYVADIHNVSTDADWKAIECIVDQDEVIELQVVGCNRGGLLVEWHTLRGFVPASQLLDFPAAIDNNARRNALFERVGQGLQLRVIELDADNNRLILSERAAQTESGTRADILTSLEPGDIIKGEITNLCEFGVFVDLGGLEGLIHISELSWGRVKHPENLLQRHQEIEVYVLGVDQQAGRVALSLKRLHPDPWATVDERYEIDEMVDGTITNVVDFGAFACIEEGLEGLIHVSELAEGQFLHPRNVVSEGQIVKARIMTIDGAARRLGLSLRPKA
jgi:small subunit ribosomal protein S1